MKTTPSKQSVRRDASMQLLTDLMEDALDLGYAEAAARRKAAAAEDGQDGQHRWSRHALVAVALLVVGALLATAAAATRARSGAAERAEDALVTEIRDRQAANARREARLNEQRLEISRRREQVLRLTDEGQAVSAALERLEVAAGVTPVVGPGVIITLADAEEAEPDAGGDPREAAPGEGRVLDVDLQTLVNSLWAAGAEAVAVDDQRLTSLSAIRSAGEAILVDFRPLVPPYDIAAVGPPEMVSRFLDGLGGSYLDVLEGAGIRQEVSEEEDVALPAAAGVTLRYAQAPGRRVGSGPADGSTGTEGGP